MLPLISAFWWNLVNKAIKGLIPWNKKATNSIRQAKANIDSWQQSVNGIQNITPTQPTTTNMSSMPTNTQSNLKTDLQRQFEGLSKFWTQIWIPDVNSILPKQSLMPSKPSIAPTWEPWKWLNTSTNDWGIFGWLTNKVYAEDDTLSPQENELVKQMVWDWMDVDKVIELIMKAREKAKQESWWNQLTWTQPSQPSWTQQPNDISKYVNEWEQWVIKDYINKNNPTMSEQDRNNLINEKLNQLATTRKSKHNAEENNMTYNEYQEKHNPYKLSTLIHNTNKWLQNLNTEVNQWIDEMTSKKWYYVPKWIWDIMKMNSNLATWLVKPWLDTLEQWVWWAEQLVWWWMWMADKISDNIATLIRQANWQRKLKTKEKFDIIWPMATKEKNKTYAQNTIDIWLWWFKVWFTAVAPTISYAFNLLWWLADTWADKVSEWLTWKKSSWNIITEWMDKASEYIWNWIIQSTRLKAISDLWTPEQQKEMAKMFWYYTIYKWATKWIKSVSEVWKSTKTTPETPTDNWPRPWYQEINLDNSNIAVKQPFSNPNVEAKIEVNQQTWKFDYTENWQVIGQYDPTTKQFTDTSWKVIWSFENWKFKSTETPVETSIEEPVEPKPVGKWQRVKQGRVNQEVTIIRKWEQFIWDKIKSLYDAILNRKEVKQVRAFINEEWDWINKKWDKIMQIYDPSVKTLIDRSIKFRSIKWNKSVTSQKKKYDDTISWLKSIIYNKDNINITDSEWNISSKLPENFSEAIQALDQTKESIYNHYNNIMKEKWATIELDLNPLIDELNKLKNDKIVQYEGKWLLDYIDEKINTINQWWWKMPATEAQKFKQWINNKLKSFYKEPNFNEVWRVIIDTLVNSFFGKSLYDSIWEEYTWIKKKYWELANVEQDIIHRANIIKNKNQFQIYDLINIWNAWDVISAIAKIGKWWSIPTAVRWMFQGLLTEFAKKMNNPDNNLKKLFIKLNDIVEQEKWETPTETPTETPEPPIDKWTPYTWWPTWWQDPNWEFYKWKWWPRREPKKENWLWYNPNPTAPWPVTKQVLKDEWMLEINRQANIPWKKWLPIIDNPKPNILEQQLPQSPAPEPNPKPTTIPKVEPKVGEKPIREDDAYNVLNNKGEFKTFKEYHDMKKKYLQQEWRDKEDAENEINNNKNVYINIIKGFNNKWDIIPDNILKQFPETEWLIKNSSWNVWHIFNVDFRYSSWKKIDNKIEYRIKTALDEYQKANWDLSDILNHFKLKVLDTDWKQIKGLRSSWWVFTSWMNRIIVWVDSKINDIFPKWEIRTFAHEFTHYLDFLTEKSNMQKYKKGLVQIYNSELIKKTIKFLDNNRYYSNKNYNNYLRQPQEILARLVEQYVAHQLKWNLISTETSDFYNKELWRWYLTEQQFEEVKPLVEEQIQDVIKEIRDVKQRNIATFMYMLIWWAWASLLLWWEDKKKSNIPWKKA